MHTGKRVRSLVIAAAVVFLSNYAIGYASKANGENKIDPNQTVSLATDSGSGTATSTPRPRSANRSGSGTATSTPRPVINN